MTVVRFVINWVIIIDAIPSFVQLIIVHLPTQVQLHCTDLNPLIKLFNLISHGL